MDLTIYTYGYSETIWNSLKAIAMLRKSALYPAMLNVVVSATGVYYAWLMAASRGEGQWRQYLLKVAGMVVVLNTLLLPTTSMNIKDNVEKHIWQVDGIPLAFALPVGVVESLGHLITMSFEQAFTTIGGKSSFNYYNYGTVFGARLAKEVMTAKVRDPEFVGNMNNFINRCVVLPAMIGNQFTKEELIATKDMWGLVSKKAGTFTRVPQIKNGVRTTPSPTCKESVPYFEKIMDESARIDISSISLKFKGAGADEDKKYNLNHQSLNDNMKKQIDTLFNTNNKVDGVLKHNMMINALNDYRSGKFPAARAKLQNEAGGLISGDLAEHILTGLLAVMKNILYGSFIFIVPLMLVAGGMAKYRMWITICLSLQLWPALFAMLNMLIDYAYEPAKIVSYSAWSTELAKFDSMASIAANLTLLIPFLAAWVTRMSEGGFIHLAGSVLATSSSATAVAAGEKSTGNISWDNVSSNNSNRNNVSEYKHDDSMQYITGTNSGIRADGSMEKILPSGQAISTSGEGYTSSSGESNYRKGEGINTALQQGVRSEQQQVASESAAYDQVRESQITQEATALTTIANNTRTDSGYSIDTSTETGRDLVQGLNAIDRLNSQNDYGWRQNAEAHMRADASFGKKLAGLIGGEINIGGSVSAENSSQQSEAQSNELITETGSHDRSSNGVRANNNEAWLESVGIDKSQQESLRESYTETSRLQESISVHQDNIKSYNETLDYTKSNNSEYSKNMYQDVVNSYKEKFGVSDADAQKAVSRGSAEAREVFNDISQEGALSIMNQLKSGKEGMANSTATSDLVDKHENKINHNPGEEVAIYAKTHGMKDAGEVSISMDDKKDSLKDDFIANRDQAEAGYNSQTAKTQQEVDGKQKAIDKYEEDRIGKGRVARNEFNGLGRLDK